MLTHKNIVHPKIRVNICDFTTFRKSYKMRYKNIITSHKYRKYQNTLTQIETEIETYIHN